MSDLPEQPSNDEINQFPQAPEPPVLVEDNTAASDTHDSVSSDDLATLSGADVDPDGEGEVQVK